MYFISLNNILDQGIIKLYPRVQKILNYNHNSLTVFFFAKLFKEISYNFPTMYISQYDIFSYISQYDILLELLSPRLQNKRIMC